MNSMMLMPCWPRAGPTGGAAVAAPAGAWTLKPVMVMFEVQTLYALKVRVALADVSQATLEQLARLGFKVTLRPTTARLVYGELPAAKLAELAALKEVLFVTRAEPMK